MGYRELGEGSFHRPRLVIRLEGPVAGGICMTVAAIGSPYALGSSGALDPDKMAGIEVLIDTGATDSCIRQDVAHALALPVMGTRHIRGVNSRSLCQVVEGIFVLRTKGTSEFKPIPLIVADIDVPMIFGMSEITQGVLVVDGEQRTWRWGMRPASPSTRP